MISAVMELVFVVDSGSTSLQWVNSLIPVLPVVVLASIIMCVVAGTQGRLGRRGGLIGGILLLLPLGVVVLMFAGQ
jgi:hypothetical protein